MDVKFDRRQLLAAAGGAFVASCSSGAPRRSSGRTGALDALLEAHAGVLPEREGAGANHYPMAAEALEAMGHEDAIDDSWVAGAALYAGVPGRMAPLAEGAQSSAALGRYDRLGDWLDLFRELLEREAWGAVVARWAPRLAPGICAASFHGVIRTGHAARALRQRNTPPRRKELAAGLAYWAARYVELPTRAAAHAGESLRQTLLALDHPWIDERSELDFSAVVPRLTERPIAAPVAATRGDGSPRAALDILVHEAAVAFLEMLVLERNRIWLLHTVTGPAAVEWLLPEVDEAGAWTLVAYARQAVVAMFIALGEPYTPRLHLHDALSPWPTLIQRAADSRSVHGIKLVDALLRFGGDGDPLWRSVAEQWFQWT